MAEKYTAVILAAGQGKRMGSSIHKQYLLLHGKPILYYSLKAFEESPVDEMILVTGKGEEEFCQKEIIDKYHLKKIRCIVEGGAERYDSVYHGLCAIDKTDYVLIHDGARPFVDNEIILRSMEAAKAYQACVVGMPVKDTIKVIDEKEFAKETPDRETLWMIQTPQAFSYPLIYESYKTLHNSLTEAKQSISSEEIKVTDDAMVVELFSDVSVKLVRGSYQNIKITTPEDLRVAEALSEKK